MHSDSFYIDRVLSGGSEQALDMLVKKYENQVFNLCFRILENQQEAEEAAQDAFLNAFKQLHKLENHSRFKAWLMRITYHKAIDYTRRVKRYPIELEDYGWQQIEDSIKSTPLESTIKKDQKSFIEWLLMKLPPLEKTVIILFYLEDLTVKEVADITNLSESNVKVKLYRTRKQLKRLADGYLKNETEDLL